STMSSTVTTAEQLLELKERGCRHELVRGELRRSPFLMHVQGQLVAELAMHLSGFARDQAIGEVLPATGFLIERDPDTVRAPNIAFVRNDRLPPAQWPGFVPGPPDLAVEVISPDDAYTEVHDKVLSWLEHGTRLVWVVDPWAKRATVYRSRDDVSVLGANEELRGDDVLPGFTVALRELFPAGCGPTA
ncbi:MAG TPA: Uma2 family endonuclease, partial [Planctomycetota bacterium]|nr:Uma2 family endonuclease [Planctomycetota bacterium]